MRNHILSSIWAATLAFAFAVVTTAVATDPAIVAFRANGELVWDHAFTNGEASIECCTNLATGGWLPVQRAYPTCGVWTGQVAATANRAFCRIAVTDYGQPRCWAEYAFWYDHYSGSINFVTGDVFWGKVHANSAIYLSGAPVFHEMVSSSATNWGAWATNAVLDKGYQLGAPVESLFKINFTNTASTQDCLRLQADLVITGFTSMAMAGTNFYISNTNRGWTSYNYGAANRSVLSNGLLYIATAASDTGTVSIAGTLRGRLTIVADGTINITNHIRYADNPSTNAGSADALGLISRQYVIVKTSCPSNLDLFAHIIATGDAASPTNFGMFTVENYDSRPASSCGNLNLYGGVVETFRGPVGTSGGAGTGYVKHYIYDTRFPANPPPHYPLIGYADH